MSKSKSVPKLRCKCVRITNKDTGGVVGTYYVLNGRLYGFITGLTSTHSTQEFIGFYGSCKGSVQQLKHMYRKGYKVQVFMYDQSKIDWC